MTQQDKKDIALLKDNCTEYTTLISNLKSQLETLQQVFVYQEIVLVNNGMLKELGFVFEFKHQQSESTKIGN